MNLTRFYLDYNATSPLSAKVKTWLQRGDFFLGNPSSQHSSGKEARKSINEVQDYLYRRFQNTENEYSLIFHSGATEAIATFLHALKEQKKKVILLHSPIDHPCLLEQPREGVIFEAVSLTSEGEVDAEKLKAQYQKLRSAHTEALIAYHHTWVHNELGIINPLSLFQNLGPEVLIYVDAVQAPGRMDDWDKIGKRADFISFSGHKFGALKGVGFSFVKKGFPFSPLLRGGGQQRGNRSGTENVMGIISLKLAMEDISFAEKTLLPWREKIKIFLQKSLQDKGELLGEKAQLHNANTLYFYLYELPSDIALALFDTHGLEISAGSACSSGTAKPSRVLEQLGYGPFAKNGLRLSIGGGWSEQKLDKLFEQLIQVFDKIPQRTKK